MLSTEQQHKDMVDTQCKITPKLQCWKCNTGLLHDDSPCLRFLLLKYSAIKYNAVAVRQCVCVCVSLPKHCQHQGPEKQPHPKVHLGSLPPVVHPKKHQGDIEDTKGNGQPPVEDKMYQPLHYNYITIHLAHAFIQRDLQFVKLQ